MEPPPTPKPTISTPPTPDAAGQSSRFLGGLYLGLTGLIDSSLPAAGPWAVAWEARSYLVKLGPIIGCHAATSLNSSITCRSIAVLWVSWPPPSDWAAPVWNLSPATTFPGLVPGFNHWQLYKEATTVSDPTTACWEDTPKLGTSLRPKFLGSKVQEPKMAPKLRKDQPYQPPGEEINIPRVNS
ncbi:hypothetical protein DSO57_1025718 [Entomophthora muscae]|uniref:Uncharacterized protein n=1 Tax=Entomophthora muscae TaxID=34485 RepID=A0ACC2UCG0_9FUNG|nr:hypothetical protein DSO57_1025718 [Entomophthora muscae]